jgi:hypothetical protein
LEKEQSFPTVPWVQHIDQKRVIQKKSQVFSPLSMFETALREDNEACFNGGTISYRYLDFWVLNND